MEEIPIRFNGEFSDKQPVTVEIPGISCISRTRLAIRYHSGDVSLQAISMSPSINRIPSNVSPHLRVRSENNVLIILAVYSYR